MEIAGTVVAVAALSGMFTTALEVLDYVKSAAAFGVTHKVLQVKIEVQKVRLMIWGQSLGLDGPEDAVNEVLTREHLRNAAASLLACFAKMLHDSETLRDRYGLVQSSGQPTKDDVENSQLLGLTFRRTYDRFLGDVRKKQRETSRVLKVRWAVVDETLFRKLVDELKAINDSLNHLVPTIRDKTRVRLRTEIMRCSDTSQLQSLVETADGDNDLVAETASLRLGELSSKVSSTSAGSTQAPLSNSLASVYQPNARSVVDRGTQTLLTGDNLASVDFDPHVSKELSPFPVGVYDNKGALVIHKVFAHEGIPSIYSWNFETEQPIELAKLPENSLKSAFNLIFVPSNLIHCAKSLLDLNVEADPEYSGWAPASVSLKGLSMEYGYRVILRKRMPKRWRWDEETPIVEIDYLVKRWKEIQKQGGLGENWTPKIGRQQVNNLTGISGTAWLDPEETEKVRHQISDLLASLSREEYLPSFEKFGSVSAAASQSIANPSQDHNQTIFHYQLLHAKELSLRLDREKDTWHGGLTRKVLYDMVAADRWMHSMDYLVEKDHANFTLREEIRQRQMESLLIFAEKMKWPFLAEVRKILTSALPDNQINICAWEWIAGIAMPGTYCALNLMLGLYQLSPSLRGTLSRLIVSVDEANYGLVLSQVSYWRSRSILGRVLVVCPGTHEICGWVGPCPAPVKLDESALSTPFVIAKAREPALRLREGTPNISDSLGHSEEQIRWEEKELPPISNEVCILKKLYLDPLPAGVSTPLAGSSSEDDLPTYRARLDFHLLRANKAITVKLYTSSIFVAAPPCHGTHRISSRVAMLYEHVIYDVTMLDKAELKTGLITVINATGHGLQALARAWCAEKGKNAVIMRRDGDCCFKCGLMVAGKEGVDMEVLILI